MLVNVLSKPLVASDGLGSSRQLLLGQERHHLLLEVLVVLRLVGSFPLWPFILLYDIGLRLEEQISQQTSTFVVWLLQNCPCFRVRDGRELCVRTFDPREPVNPIRVLLQSLVHCSPHLLSQHELAHYCAC